MNVKMNMKKILTALLLSLAAVTGCKKEDLDLTVTIELEPAVTVTSSKRWLKLPLMLRQTM